MARTLVDENKALVERFYREAINERRAEVCQTLLAEGFVHNGEKRGRDEQQRAVQVFLDGFSDLHDEIEFMLGEGDLVAAHQTWTGTHDGAFSGIPASGKKVRFTSTAVIRVEDGLIAEAWDEVDVIGLMQQLGALPDPG